MGNFTTLFQGEKKLHLQEAPHHGLQDTRKEQLRSQYLSPHLVNPCISHYLNALHAQYVTSELERHGHKV